MKIMKNNLILTAIAGLILAGGLISFAAKAPEQPAASVPEKQEKTLEQPATQQTPDKEIKLDKSVKAAEDKPAVTTTPPANANEYAAVSSLNIVDNPSAYLGKKVRFKASFDKFSTLGLDYKPAFRDSQKYISFLIKRDDVTDHTIPLSEMKIFIKRSEAEKFIELDSGDTIEVYGKVFSDALTDAWVDADKLVILCKKNKDDNKKDKAE